MSLPSSQLPLDLGYQPSLTRDDFLVSPSNQIAVHWIDRWPGWPTHALILIGPASAGKSHLGRIWAAQSGAAIIAPDDLSEDLLLGGGPEHLVIDQADLHIGDRKSEEILFHLYNQTRAQGRNLLLTMRAAPFVLNFIVPDLASRLRSALTIGIDQPDDDLLSAILVKLFHDRQLQIGDDVLRYVVPRMERSFAAAEALVDRADRAALADKRSVTVPLMRNLLQSKE
jgi:chromosomal replication initiation ATPase DnaA